MEDNGKYLLISSHLTIWHTPPSLPCCCIYCSVFSIIQYHCSVLLRIPSSGTVTYPSICPSVLPLFGMNGSILVIGSVFWRSKNRRWYRWFLLLLFSWVGSRIFIAIICMCTHEDSCIIRQLPERRTPTLTPIIPHSHFLCSSSVTSKTAWHPSIMELHAFREICHSYHLNFFSWITLSPPPSSSLILSWLNRTGHR